MKIFVDRADAFASKPAPTLDLGNAQIQGAEKDPLWERACSRRGRWPQLTFCALLVMSLSACTVGPDFQKPQPQQITEWSKPSRSAASQAIAETMDEHWWDVFHDPKLSALTQRALTDNLDLKLASSRLQQSRAVRQVITANRYPNTAATGSYGRKRNSGEGLNDPSGHIGDSAYNLWDAGFSASWELDFWGRVRRETEAADAGFAAPGRLWITRQTALAAARPSTGSRR